MKSSRLPSSQLWTPFLSLCREAWIFRYSPDFFRLLYAIAQIAFITARIIAYLSLLFSWPFLTIAKVQFSHSYLQFSMFCVRFRIFCTNKIYNYTSIKSLCDIRQWRSFSVEVVICKWQGQKRFRWYRLGTYEWTSKYNRQIHVNITTRESTHKYRAS